MNAQDLPIDIQLQARTATVRVRDGKGGSLQRFRLHRAEDLTAAIVQQQILPDADADHRPLLVHFKRASPDARQLLRRHRVSYISDQDDWFIYAPPMVIDRENRRRSRRPDDPAVQSAARLRNPFARQASRVPRWLLLHAESAFSIRELAHATELSEALVSRVVQSMEDQAWVERTPDPSDDRVKRVRMQRPRDVLNEWRGNWQRKRIATRNWDIRADAADDVVRRVKKVATSSDLRWAVGGVAGAAYVQKLVEPSSVLIWTTGDQFDTWEEAFIPAHVSPARAQLRLAAVPDRFTLNLTTTHRGVPVADAVQLWLDCSTESERALEAAEAIAAQMHW